MEKGKFSQPRPYRDEERQIEETFRQLTEKGGSKKRQPVTPAPVPESIPEKDFSLPEDTFSEIPDLPEEVPVPVSGETEPVPEAPPAPSPAPMPTPAPPPDVPARPAPVPPPAPFPVWEEDDWEDSEDEDTAHSDNLLDKLMDFCVENRKWVLVGLCAVALVMIIAVTAVFAVGASGSDDEVFQGNVFIAGVNVSGMTKSQAVSAVKQATDSAYAHNDMVVDLAGTKLLLSPTDTGAQLDAKAAVDAAFTLEPSDEHQYIALLPYMELDTDYIRTVLEAYAADSGSSLTQHSYGLEGDYPELDAEKFKENTAQTLVLTLGTPGISFDVDAVYNQILDAYSLFSFLVTVEDVQSGTEPEPVDLEAIYEEFYVAPVDSTVDMQTFEVIPGSYGYEFDLDAAQVLVDSAQPGDVLRIPMVFIEPELIDEDILFRDVMGEFQTRIDGSARKNNVRLASEAINGTVLQPGDTFSFLDTVGRPSSSKGYKEAEPCSEHETEAATGIGICQAATTLYNSVLLADLEVVSRTSHSFPVEYVDYGMDANVSWDGPDFRFRNNTNYPIEIEAEVSGSYVTVRILGTEQRDYTVKMDYEITATHKPDKKYEEFEYNNAEGYLDGDVIRKGVTGYSVKTYKLKYSRKTGDLVSKDYEASSRYQTVDYLVARVAEPETTEAPTVPPTTVPPTTAPPETTVPPTTAPAETVPQETRAPETTAAPAETQPAAQTIQETVSSISETEAAA